MLFVKELKITECLTFLLLILSELIVVDCVRSSQANLIKPVNENQCFRLQ